MANDNLPPTWVFENFVTRNINTTNTGLSSCIDGLPTSYADSQKVCYGIKLRLRCRKIIYRALIVTVSASATKMEDARIG